MRVSFVCLGNICRSPTAMAVTRALATRAGVELEVDSCGTSDWHAGESADARTIAHAKRRGYDLAAHRARRLDDDDFAKFDRLFAMDLANLDAMTKRCPPEHRPKLGLLLDLVPSLGLREVPDPWSGGADGFERVLDLVETAARALVAELARAA